MSFKFSQGSRKKPIEISNCANVGFHKLMRQPSLDVKYNKPPLNPAETSSVGVAVHNKMITSESVQTSFD